MWTRKSPPPARRHDPLLPRARRRAAGGKPLYMPIELNGLVIPFAATRVLVVGPDADAFGVPLFGPPVFVRPGYPLWNGQGYLLPDEAIDDIGQRFKGRDAYLWIEERGDAFPRADAIGVLASGTPHSVFMKELDLANLALFASEQPSSAPVRLDLLLEALAIPDGYALAPAPPPSDLAPFARALPSYRLAPGAFGALGAALVHKILRNGRRDLEVTFDDLDDLVEW